MPAPRLSPREVEVVLGWLHAQTKEALAQQLYLSPGTINTHLARIRGKYAAVIVPHRRRRTFSSGRCKTG
nr:LuxR C-terminal-related transcriptional regulator [Rhodococcus wratislaviensis]